MIATRSCIVCIIYVMGAICAFPQFSDTEEKQFHEYILQEHNKYREEHRVKNLEFSIYSNNWAYKYLNDWMKNTSEIPNVYSVNSYSIELNENSKLDAELAKQIVTEWYKTGEGYKYDEEPSSDTAGRPFTRIVWKSATEFGVEITMNNNNLYVVAYYYNIDVNAKYMDNVMKPRDDVQEN